MATATAPLLAGSPHDANGGGVSTPQGPALPPVLQKLWNFVMHKTPSFGARVAESLDYEPIQNDLYFGRVRARRGGTRHVYGYSGLTLAKNLVMIMTGFFTGLVGVILSKTVKTLIEYRNDAMESILDHSDSFVQAFIFNMAYGVTLVMAAACMVTFWAPTAAGAGVTLVMAYLNGTHIPNLLRFRTLLTKVVGAALAVPSGLAIGPEGPMVHIGACIASTITYANCAAVTWLRYVWPWPCNGLEEGDDDDSLPGDLPGAPVQKGVWCQTWEELHEDSEHREFISAGAAAGLSAAFGAPIGGVLFAMEEASSFWSRKVAWRCFIAAICAAFMMSFSDISETGSGAGRGIIVFSNVHVLKNYDWIRQFPFMVLVAAIGGGLGAMFNWLRRVLWKIRASRSRKVLRVVEAFMTIVYCIIVQFVAATHWGSCQQIPEKWPEEFKGVKWGCDTGSHNDLATAFWSTPDDLLSRLFSVGHEDTKNAAIDETGFTQYSLLLYSIIYLSMLALCAGVCVPAGMFMPAVMLGAATGLAAGVQLQHMLPHYHIQPGLYALICATAALAGVFRSAISLVVLVVEGTRGINFLFGVIIAVVVANFVGSVLGQDGVYESEIERDGNVFYLHHEPPRKLSTLTAEEVMVKNPRCLPAIVSVRDVLTVLRDTTHHGFPVVQQMSSLEEGVGQLEGLVLRSQLLVLLREKMYCDVQGLFLNPEHAQVRYQYKVERAMRLFYRLRYTHHRYMATHDSAIVDLNRAISHADSRRVLHQSASQENVTNGLSIDAQGQATSVEGGGGTVFDSPMLFDEEELLDEEDDRAQVAVEEFRESVGQIDNPDNLYLNLRPFMNYAPLTVPKEMSAARTHRTFVTLGMRHLCVVNNSNRVVGIITRKDLEHAAAHGSHDHPAQHLQVSRSLIASTSRVFWRHNEEDGGQHRRVSSAAVRLPDTLPVVEEYSNEGGQNGSYGDEQHKKETVEHMAHVSPVADSPVQTHPVSTTLTDTTVGEDEPESHLGPRQRTGQQGPDRGQ